MSREAEIPLKYSPGPWLRRLARASAWALLVGVVVLVVSGWGITQTGVIYKLSFGLIDRRLANAIHRETNLPLAFFFLVHVLINVKISLTRRHPSRAWLINGSLIALGLAVLAAAAYMDHFRRGG
jgi:cytochrome b subunit of formate dehydrogenase